MFAYDFALSFAGEDRPIAERVATRLKQNGARVFYDVDYSADLLGKDLAAHFAKLYRDEARFCVMFLSRKYIEKTWCRWERRSAIARAFVVDYEYVLPYRLEPVDLPAIPDTIGRADLASTPPEGFADLLLRKLFLSESGLEIAPGIYLATDASIPLLRTGEALMFEMDDRGFDATVRLPIIVRNVNDTSAHVAGVLELPSGGRDKFGTEVGPRSQARIELMVARALRHGDGTIDVTGPAELTEQSLRQHGQELGGRHKLQDSLAEILATVRLAEYRLLLEKPASAFSALVLAAGQFRLRS